MKDKNINISSLKWDFYFHFNNNTLLEFINKEVQCNKNQFKFFYNKKLEFLEIT